MTHDAYVDRESAKIQTCAQVQMVCATNNTPVYHTLGRAVDLKLILGETQSVSEKDEIKVLENINTCARMTYDNGSESVTQKVCDCAFWWSHSRAKK